MRLNTGNAARIAAALIVTLATLGGPWAPTTHAQLEMRRRDGDAHRVKDATAVLSDMMSAADRAIPRAILEKAEAMAVFPRLPRVEQRRGEGPRTRRLERRFRPSARGIVSVRGAGGAWSAPAFLSLMGGDVPQDADLVLVIVKRSGVEKVLGHEFAIGPDSIVAPGPVGDDVVVSSALEKGTEIFSYSRVRGVLEGISLAGSTLQNDMIAHQRFYGKPLTAKEAVAETGAREPLAVWRAELQKHSPKLVASIE
jgi:lipid-binding SYLF domain-containing protein